MVRRISLWLGGLLLALVVAWAAVLVEAHLEMRRVTPELPDSAAISALPGAGDGPVRLSYVNTATQPWPGGRHGGYISFVLEWADGRIFLIDAGMRPDVALAFGRALELTMGAGPAEAHGAIGSQLGAASARVKGIGFTHLHYDHTDALSTLCDAGAGDVILYQTPDQRDRGNYSTWTGRDDIERAGCVAIARLDAKPLAPIPGFPGLAAIAVGGHTPGSTAFAARVGPTTWIFSGDITNSMADLLEDRPKPAVYGTLIIPEHTGRLALLRRWVVSLGREQDRRIAVSHDLDAVRASGMPAWGSSSGSAVASEPAGG